MSDTQKIEVVCVCGERAFGYVGQQYNNKDILNCGNCGRKIVIVVIEN